MFITFRQSFVLLDYIPYLLLFLFSVALVFAFGKNGITKVIPKRSLTLSSAVNYKSAVGFAVRAGAILCGLNRAAQSYGCELISREKMLHHGNELISREKMFHHSTELISR